MIKKFLKYYRLVFLVSVLTLKYRILIIVLSDPSFIKYINRRFFELRKKRSLVKANLTKKLLIKRINKVCIKFYPNITCLVRSLVLNEVLILKGYTDETIKFGVKYDQQMILAHAWVHSKNDFKILFKI